MIREIQGDITKSTAHAIVNAANTTLLGGGGVDGAIHEAAGLELALEVLKEPSFNYGNRCEIGGAVITKSGNLFSKYVIHTVGPRYFFDPNPERLLKSCYTKSLDLAIDNGCKSIAFPAISTGVYRFPPKEAKKIALDACEKYKNQIDIALYFF